MGTKINLVKPRQTARIPAYMEPVKDDWVLLERRDKPRTGLTYSPTERTARGLAVYGSSSSKGGGMQSLDIGSSRFDPDTQMRYEMLLKALQDMEGGK